MQGPGADALSTLFFNYAMDVRKLTGWDDTFLCSRLDEGASIGEKHAKELQKKLDGTYIVQADSAGGTLVMADGVAFTAAVGEGGLNPVADIAAVGLGIFTIGTMIWESNQNAQAQTAAIDAVNTAATNVVAEWQPDIATNANTTQTPQTPTPPVGPDPGDFGKFLVTILKLIAVVGAGGAVAYFVYNQWPVPKTQRISTMTPQELEQLKNYLAQITGCSPTQIQNIIDQIMAQDPTGEQLKKLLDALKIRSQLQTLLDQVNAAKNPGYAKFAKDIQDLIDVITKEVKNGKWIDWNPTAIQTWTNNLNGFSIQWSGAQALNATTLEQPITGSHADIIGRDGIWYEFKYDQNITNGDGTFNKIEDQLYKYFTDPN